MAVATPVSKRGAVVKVGDRLVLFGTATAVSASGSVTFQIEDPSVKLTSQLTSVVINSNQLAHS
jgi:hypothetical protein